MRPGVYIACMWRYAALIVEVILLLILFLVYLPWAMPRRKAPETKKAADWKNEFVGKKMLLLTNFASLWRQAIDCGEQSDFYNKITTLVVNRWGYHENYGSLTDDPDDESDNDIPSVFPAEDKEEGEEDLTAAEAKRRQIIYKKLRTVKKICLLSLTL